MDALSTDKLRRRCDPASLPFASTTDLAERHELIGQARALDAISLSSQMPHRDFNVFVVGPNGTGRHTAALKLLGNEASKRTLPADWVYVNNFEAAHKPKALCLPPGTALKLKRTMQKIVDDLGSDIPALFESEEYQTQRRAFDQELGEAQEASMADFADRAKAEDVALLRTPMGFMLTAIRGGELVKTEDYQKLDEDEQAEIDEKIRRLQEDLASVLRQAPKREKDHRKRVEELNAQMAERAVSARVAEVETELQAIQVVAGYLENVREDIISNAELFLQAAAEKSDGPFPEAIHKFHRDPMFDRYVVNVMVPQDGEPREGAPVLTEDLPTLDRVTGRIEHASHMGSLMTNFTMIRPGALHRANGGYLVLDARRILSEPYAWDALKRCLKNQAITITSMAERLSLVSTTSLEPDPIPLNLRVVLIGDRMLYTLLVLLDPDFSELFKLQADFEDVVDRTEDNLIVFARLLGSFALREGLRPMTAASVARLLDEATRLADDSKKLSLRLGALSDFIREADHYAAGRDSDHIDDSDIERAVTEREKRASRIKDRIQEAITRKTVLIDTDGAQVGQINGLAVIGLGDYRFGRPSRITARVRMGAGKLVDIEREVELGGPLHSKGVMILSGYLTSTYALDVPFSLHASLVFEQSYGGIDGDSASSAELYALLSALSGLPIHQGIAVTGSVNQTGQVQAIGGVNEKIEGFFETCAARGLTGDQGVLIPKSNIEHLMLRSDVVDAAEAGKFRVIPIETIDQGIAVLTGTEAGVRDASGAFPDGTVNALVEAKLRGFAETRKAFARPTGKDSDGTDK
ncbi:AAA family ATPase [Alisedimentitalea sp. MJ-SS2]|uniref:Lon protease family protein n=1 Tax=Aliisedimentitalea sp. MJ-SS2 TaxID=3049795 RepID=UPI0029151F3F|nr:AAA family ATPase [Alisedimentitalea sp. MJ-SS2]MDU8925760.1 AAA family ATPase [Alisedimentitalea sp. MJ-SS2]